MKSAQVGADMNADKARSKQTEELPVQVGPPSWALSQLEVAKVEEGGTKSSSKSKTEENNEGDKQQLESSPAAPGFQSGGSVSSLVVPAKLSSKVESTTNHRTYSCLFRRPFRMKTGEHLRKGLPVLD